MFFVVAMDLVRTRNNRFKINSGNGILETMTKTEKIQHWLHRAKNVSYGKLHLMGDRVFTYNVLLAKVNRELRTAEVDVSTYSVTSSGHRNRVLEALSHEGYSVTEVDGPLEA